MAPPTATELDLLRARVADLTRAGKYPLVVSDERGLIAHADMSLARALGWTPAELFGRPVTAIIPPRFRDAHHLGFSRYLATRRPQLLERPLNLPVLHRDGREIAAEHVIVALTGARDLLFAAGIRVGA